MGEGRVVTRRVLLSRLGLACGATVLAGTGLVGCAVSGAAKPESLPAVLHVPFQINVQGAPTAASTALVQQYVDEHFNAEHPGVQAQYVHWTTGPEIPGLVAAITAGQGPYILTTGGCDTCFPSILPFLKPLDGLLRQDNIPLSLWSSGQLATFRYPQGLMAVPAYTAAQPYVYRQDILDELGLTYPEPDWTYTDAVRIWQGCVSDKGGRHRYAATLDTQPGDIGEGYFLFQGFGGAFMDATHTRCLLDQSGSIAGGEWAFDLIWNGVATNRGHWPGGELAGLWLGECVFSEGAGGTMLSAVENLGTRFKWDLIPYPRWPVRPATAVQVDFYGINAAAPRQDIAWELFKFVTLDPGLNGFVMKLSLQEPALLSLWDEWEAILRATAPVLRTKAIGYWKQAAVDGYGYGVQFFRYEPIQAVQVIDGTWADIWQHRMSVSEGFGQIVQQVDALETAAASAPPPATGAQRIAAAQRERRRLARMLEAAR